MPIDAFSLLCGKLVSWFWYSIEVFSLDLQIYLVVILFLALAPFIESKIYILFYMMKRFMVF